MGREGPALYVHSTSRLRGRIVGAVLRSPILLSLAVVIAGLVWVLTVGSLLGALLVVGGVAGLGWSMVPAAVDRIASFLSTGSLRKTKWPL